MKILVLGGAGYIGSHFAYLASAVGHEVILYDNLSTGYIRAARGLPLLQGDILDTEYLTEVCIGLDAVCHFAAKSLVAESVADPAGYFKNNVDGTESVLRAMSNAGVSQLVFSSTAATYGIPQSGVLLLDEEHITAPINPYGDSKLRAENAIASWVECCGGKAIAFRYFNAAGAMPEVSLGEAHEPETHLIPNILKALLAGSRQKFYLYGDDYPTPDGSCVRDYVHVKDIGLAHLAGLDFLAGSKDSFTVCNLGSSVGYSIFEVIRACERVSGQKVNVEIQGRRAGDPPILVASNQRAKDVLSWGPMHSGLDEIVESAFRWHQQHG